ncbi:class I SAM-dependent methyltransferase [Pseudodesulfovibrio tunisiensis]|uniref:class I SAM-dependent methyltransferase n=1 Tax=Pseudodesulfovibrio tunisiensis TaxID=463192 RepID=UPI001FB25B16|nr:class I SAM-dependent methyltransferase [Pseudodesulfovibrio tunisiensis]
MSRHVNIIISGETVRKHPRDVRKDDIIKGMLPPTPARIFEASAGSAILSRELQDTGHDVTISNYHRLNFPGLKEIEVDLNKDIPLPDASFNAIICREVIEHVESVPHTLREFNRLLRPGGTLVLTFPNRLHIRSRFYHVLTGFYRGMQSPINLDVPFGEGHVNLIGYPEMDYFLRKFGFEPGEVSSSFYQATDKLLLALRPLIRLTTRFYLLNYKKHAQEHEKTKPDNIAYNTKIADILTSKPLFIGKDVIVSARKTL